MNERPEWMTLYEEADRLVDEASDLHGYLCCLEQTPRVARLREMARHRLNRRTVRAWRDERYWQVVNAEELAEEAEAATFAHYEDKDERRLAQLAAEEWDFVAD